MALCCPQCKQPGNWWYRPNTISSIRCRCGWQGYKRQLKHLGIDGKPLPEQIKGQTNLYDFL